VLEEKGLLCKYSSGRGGVVRYYVNTNELLILAKKIVLDEELFVFPIPPNKGKKDVNGNICKGKYR